MSNRLPLIIAAGAVVIAGGYFGLSVYAGKQAQKHLEDWVYDMSLDDKLSWESVSSSPLGGRVSIAGLEVEMGQNKPNLQIAEVVISERVEDDTQTRVRLQLKGIEADSSAFRDLRSLSAMAGGSLNREFARASHGFEPALNSGLATLKPFDLEMYFNVDDDAGTLETELAIALPELFDTRVSYRLDNQRDLNRNLKRLGDDIDGESNLFELLGQLEVLGRSLERAEIGSIRVSLQDRGMLERSIALHQRYNTPLDPTAGSADKQRRAHYEQLVADTVKNCERESRDLPKGMDNGCELVSKVMLGKVDGVELIMEPKESVRLTDLAKLDDARSGKRVLERLNPQLDSL
ncbi:MAG TPA: hypothetical protein VN156_08075 [Pseudomonas sp.]|nr:hypothetical protein [Pseudomonas sp.]